MLSETQIESCIETLFRQLDFPKEPENVYAPQRYMIAIGGKRIRPRLCLTAYAALGGKALDETVTAPAAGLELFHTFSLIHDDIMDNSPLRRGQQTVWKKWGGDIALLSGDAMLIESYKYMLKAPEQVRSRVLSLFSENATKVCEGQQLDMDFEQRTEVSMPQYEEMIGCKTAALLACAAGVGALISGADAKTCDALYGFGWDLGMAFQIADDYLDAYADQSVFGKPIGGDILNEKKSWLTVRALEKTDDKAGLLQLLSRPAGDEAGKAAKIAAVKAAYERLDVPREALEAIAAWHAAAEAKIAALQLEDEGTQVLGRFAHSLIGRVK